MGGIEMAKGVGKVLLSPIRLVGKAIGGLMPKPKKSDAPKPLASATRDDARIIRDQEDELRRRKGGLADVITGTSGAEPASSGGKTTLGS